MQNERSCVRTCKSSDLCTSVVSCVGPPIQRCKQSTRILAGKVRSLGLGSRFQPRSIINVWCRNSLFALQRITVHAVETFGVLENIAHYSHFECDHDLQLYAEYGSTDCVKTVPNIIAP